MAAISRTRSARQTTVRPYVPEILETVEFNEYQAPMSADNSGVIKMCYVSDAPELKLIGHQVLVPSRAQSIEAVGLGNYFMQNIAWSIFSLAEPYLAPGDVDPFEYRSVRKTHTRTVKVKLNFRGAAVPTPFPDE